MTITFPRAFPTHRGMRGVSIRPRKVVGVATSPTTLVQQVYEWPGERWEFDVTLPIMNRADGEAWVAWLISLRGPVGSCLMGDTAGAVPRGAAASTPGTPQVDGNHAARSRTLAVKTTGLSTTANWLRAGDWFQLGTGGASRLHKVLADASLDGSGETTLDIWPALREAVANDAAVTVSAAKGRFQLAVPPQYAYDTALLLQLNVVPFVEDLRPA